MPLAESRHAHEIEAVDKGDYDPAELRSNLADLRLYNRWFGGTRIILRELGRMPGLPGRAGRITLLDVATGSGDIPAEVARWGARRGIVVTAAGLDANPDVLSEASRFQGSRRRPHRAGLMGGEACRLPCADRSVDVVVCSNFLHHLDTPAAVAALREMKRVARAGVITVDLVRGRASLLLVWLLTRLTTGNRLTRNDGPLSVRRAFRPAELAALAREAGLDGARVRRAGLVRMVMTCRLVR